MSVGSVMVGVAVLAVVAAYVARPFRTLDAPGGDRTIEAWVARVQREGERSGDGVTGNGDTPTSEAPARIVNFCPQCGQRVDEGDRFCSNCGARLTRGR